MTALRSITAIAAAIVTTALAHSARAQQWTWTIHDINPSQSSNDTMTPFGSSGGRVNGLGAARNGTTFYAASEWGGLFRTTDTGQTWTHLAGHVPQATWDVEVDPGNVNHVYATSLYDGRVNSRSGINVSVDGGTTWTHPASATPPAGFCADAARRTELSAFGIAIDPASSAHVYVGTNCGLARSNDGGVTWTFIDPTPGDGADDVWDVVVHHGGIIDLCGDDGHRRSTDGGATWTTATGTALPAGRCSIAASPDEANVLFAVVGVTLRESDDGGATWSAAFTNPAPQGRIPFVAVNKRAGSTFDLYFGDVVLWRTSCTTPTPPNSNLRCPTNSWTTVQTGAHPDAGDIVFAPGVTQDACPVLFSNDGGVYRNTIAASPACHDPTWEQATVTTHALWVFGMAGAPIASPGAESLYMGNQDNGAFATSDAPAAAPSWTNPDCCDVHDVAAEDSRVVYTGCCFFSGRGNRLFISGRGMTGVSEINTYPAGDIRSFSQGNSIARFAPNSYAVLTTSGVFITTDIGASPVAWTQLGTATTPANARDIKVAISGGTPTFYVLSGQASGRAQDQLFFYAGTNASGHWTQVTPPGNTGGFGIFAVDPANPSRLIASHLQTGHTPEMVRSSDGGKTWSGMADLDQLMTGNGQFQYQNQRGLASGLPGTAASSFSGYPQPTLVAFDPGNASVILAGGADSGVFLTLDDGAHWMLLTDPFTPQSSGREHIPRPWYAYFDHEVSTPARPGFDVYVGTQGRGVWRISLRQNLADLTVASCTHPAGSLTTGTSITFTAVVRNVGTLRSPPSTLSFRIGGETPPGQTVAVPALDPGASFTTTRQASLSMAQNYRNTITADFDGRVTESNEANNVCTDDYVVVPGCDSGSTRNRGCAVDGEPGTARDVCRNGAWQLGKCVARETCIEHDERWLLCVLSGRRLGFHRQECQRGQWVNQGLCVPNIPEPHGGDQ